MTLPMLIYQQISSSFNVGFAAALGMVLLTISLVLVIAYNRILGLVSGQRDLQ
jgi:putative spermidine/putrescine transport system permease protein